MLQNSQSLISIKDIYQNAEKVSELLEIKVGGWVKSIRESKEIIFITLNDGSISESLQLIILRENFSQNYSLGKINFASCLLVSGKLTLTPQLKQIEIINPEVVRDYPHLRAKTNYFLTIFRLRHNISRAIHDFFHHENFYYVPTPIITSSDAEGAGEFFNVTANQKEPFFSKPASLTVSGQLQAETLAQGLGKVYTFSPCFRAENSHTTRHLVEFYMVEPEMAFADLDKLINLAERLIKYELKFLEKFNEKEIISKLQKILTSDFKKIKKEKNRIDLQSEHEKYLCRYFSNQPVFVTNYPLHLKAFYMKNNLDNKTASSFDLLLPEIGELIGASMREDNYEILREKALKIGLDTNNLRWYLDLRRYGYASSGGFGLGLERLIMFISGTENIRDVIAFPRYPKRLEF
ncbi:asparagine--tRNA ligase [Tuber brumale]|nr:asparagine--tRNA ligase [Tuber brumale]